MKKIFFVILFINCLFSAQSQTLTLAQIKKILDTTSNPIGFVKFVLKKKFYIDTVAVISTSSFLGKADSLAYYGKVGKVYGPFKKENRIMGTGDNSSSILKKTEAETLATFQEEIPSIYFSHKGKEEFATYVKRAEFIYREHFKFPPKIGPKPYCE